MLLQNPAAAMHIIELLCERLRNTSRLVEDTAFLAAGPRLARALLRLTQAHGVQVDGVWKLDMHLPQSTLGAHVGLMRESVNRQMRAWQEDGVITSDDAGITVVSRSRKRRRGASARAGPALQPWRPVATDRSRRASARTFLGPGLGRRETSARSSVDEKAYHRPSRSIHWGRGDR